MRGLIMKRITIIALLSLLLTCTMLLNVACGQKGMTEEKNKTEQAAEDTQNGEKADEIKAEIEVEKEADKDVDEGENVSSVPLAAMQKNRCDLFHGKFQLDGKEFQLPVPFTEIQALGWSFEEADLNENTSVFDVSLGEVWLTKDSQGQTKRLYVYLVPASEENPEIKNAFVYKIGTSVLIYRDNEYVKGMDADLVLPGGLHAYDELASFKKQYGEPNYTDGAYVTIEYGYGIIERFPLWEKDVLYSGLRFSPEKVMMLSINQNLPFIDPEDVDGKNLEVPEGTESLLPEPEKVSAGGLEFEVPLLAADLLNDGWEIFDIHSMNGQFESADSRGVIRGSENVIRMDGKKYGAEIKVSFVKEGNILSTVLVNYGKNNTAYENCYISEIRDYFVAQP